MNYNRVYNELIENAKHRGWTKKTAPTYVECHHIIPRSLGGSNSKDNLVFLTYREHFLGHWLLFKLATGLDKSKMANAWFRMCQVNEFQSRCTSKHYSRARKAFSDNNPFKQSSIIESVRRRMTDNNPMKNPEISNKVREKMKGKFIGDKNPAYDSTVYHWKNIKTGEQVSMTRYNFYTTYNLRGESVGRIARKLPGHYSVKGWITI